MSDYWHQDAVGTVPSPLPAGSTARAVLSALRLVAEPGSAEAFADLLLDPNGRIPAGQDW